MRIDATSTTTAVMTPANAKLVDGARQFEAMMLGEMLKPLSFGASPEDSGEDAQGGAAGTIRGFGTEAMAKSIASAGGFGLARQIIRQVTEEQDASHGEAKGTKV